ncbi:MAG: hypothetical protein LAP38_00965 [Acidobacteriia bacterium]|nr:hypothetical protein [Terriglobia bacterium]
MRSLVSAAIFVCLVGTAFGQGRGGQYWSLGGFGNVLYPGTGHAPAMPPGGFNGPRFPTGSAGRPVVRSPLPAAHPFHQRGSIVPYPVFYGGYGYDYGYDTSSGYGPNYAPGYGDQAPPIVNTNSAPSVVINQNFVPPQANPVVREYGNPNPDEHSSAQDAVPAQRANEDQATLYLIAFKDHSIVQALGYWMEGSNLHYVTVDHALNQASLDLIDRDLSQRLNTERGVEFRLPAR